MLLEDMGALEGKWVMNTASIADGIVYNDEWIQQGDKLVKGQIAIGEINVNMYLAIQQVVPILVKPSVAMKARPLE